MLIPSDYAQINYRFEGTGLRFGAEMTIGVNVELFSGTPDEAAEAAFDAAENLVVHNYVSSSVSLVETSIKYGPNATGPIGLDTGTFTGLGGSQASANTAYLISKRTGFGGRTGRGRWYLPGVVESLVGGDGDLENATVAAITADHELYRTAMSAAGLVPVLLHSVGSPVSVPLPITEFVCSGFAATQRRRMRR